MESERRSKLLSFDGLLDELEFWWKFSREELGDSIEVKRALLTSQNGHPVSEIDAYLSILTDSGVADPNVRRDLVAEHYKIIFPIDLV